MEMYLRIYTFITKIIAFLITPFLYLRYDIFGKQNKLPPLNNPLLNIGAVDLADKIRNREVNKFNFNIVHCHDVKVPSNAITMIFTFNFKRLN